MKIIIQRKLFSFFLVMAIVISLMTTLTLPANAEVLATQELNLSWKTDATNGFFEPNSSLGSDKIKYENNSIWIDSTATSNEWIEFTANPGEGLEAFDLTSVTLGKYENPAITFEFTVTGTKKSDGSEVSKNFSWTSGTELTKQFSGIDFTQITKFRITVQNISTKIADIEFQGLTIANQTGSGNTSPVISGFSDVTYLENAVNADFLQVDSDVAVTDNESADFDGGQVTVSYSGTPLAQDQLSVGNIGNISLSGNVVNYSGVGQIGTISGGTNGTSLIITLNANATPARTTELLRAITYKNTSDEPASHRTISITVSDGDGGTSTPVTAKISVSGQAESGTEYPALTQDLNSAWVEDLNNGFTIQGNSSVTLGSDATSIWINNSGSLTVSFNIAAAEQFTGGMFDLSSMTFDVLGTGKTYTVTIIGHKSNGSTVTASVTGDSKAALETIDLTGITGIVSFDFQVTAPTTGDVANIGLDSFTISNPGTTNAPPTEISLGSSTIAENAAPGTTIGTLTTTDADTGDTHTYSLVSGIGDTDNASFAIAGNELRSNEVFDYETKSAYSIRIRTTDAAGVYFEKAFTLSVTDAYENPVVTTNNALTLDEDAAATVITNTYLKTTVNAGRSAIYTLTTAPVKGTVKKSGTGLNAGDTFTQSDIDTALITYTPNANANNMDEITFSVTDGMNTLAGNTFTINITPVNDAPVIASSTGVTADEGEAVTITQSALEVTDIDSAAGALTYTISTAPVNGTLYKSGVAMSAGGTFTQDDINNSRITYTHNGNETLADSFIFTASDGAGGTIGATTFSITVNPTNDDPFITGLPSDITVTENTPSNVDLSAVTLTDADSGGNSITLTLSVNSGTLSATSGGGITVSGSGTPTLTLTGSAANIDTYLNTASNIQYTGAEGSHGNNADTLTLIANDCGYTGTGGGGDISLGTVNIDITTIAPTVTNVTSTNNAGTYGIGETIAITVEFSHAVTVTGTPQLALETGVVDRTANYSIGSGTNTLTFTYTTQAGDESPNLNYKATNSLSLNGGTIKRGDTNAVLTLPAPNTAGSLGANKAIVIQSFPSVSLSVGSANIAENGGTSTITATLSEISSQDVVVTLSYSGTATSGTDYNHNASTTITIPAGSLSANAVTGITAIQDADPEGNETIIIDIAGVSKGIESGVQQQTITILDDDIPVVVSVSSATTDGSYKAGDVIAVTITFNAAVTVTGTPQLLLETGTTDRTINYTSGSGTTTLTFNYTVQSGDTSGDLDYVGTGSLTLNGGSITSSGVAASLVLPTPGAPGSLRANKAIVIDTTAPTAEITVADTALKAGETSMVTITFSEAVTGFANADLTIANGGLSIVNSMDGGITWTATLTPAADIEDNANVITLNNTGVLDAAGNEGVGTTESNNYAIDTKHPTATVAMSSATLAQGQTCTVTFTFSEVVTGFANDDITIDNGILAAVSSADGGVTYTAAFTAASVNDDTNTIIVNLTGITDTAGNAGTGTACSANYKIIIPTAPGMPTIGTATAGNGQVTVSFTPPASDGGAAITSYTVTASPGGITATGNASPITVTGLTNGTAYTFTVTATNSAGTGAASAASNSVTPQAPSTGGGGGNSTPTQTYQADVKAGGAGSRLPVTVDRHSGSASVDASSQSNLMSEGKSAIITIPSIPNVDTYSVGIPIPDLSTADTHGSLTVDTEKGSIIVPSNMLTGIKGTNGKKAQITIGEGDKNNLPDKVKAVIGVRPLIRITMSIDGRLIEWSNPAAQVTVSIPYMPTAEELANPESIVVWYIDGSGNVVTTPNGRYDVATGMVTFSTTHLSDYAVAFNKVVFSDVTNTAWYSDAVSFIAAREITTGTGGGKYSPNAKLTRGELIVLTMRTYGISPVANPTDNFSDAGNAYYTGYLAAAKRLGITSGVGNNMYMPDKEITRQEMFTLLYNTLKVIGQLPQGDSGKILSDFTDAGQVSSWAIDAIDLLVKTGTISGSGRKLIPTATTTRAEMAQVLYNLISK